MQLLENKSVFQPKKGHQRDPYIGPLHHQTKKRHGKGNFQYKNKFFQYDGQYLQGKKHGNGILKMNDGTKIQANFVDDQIQGQSKITYSDGSVYKGQLKFGQKDGKGVYQSVFQRYQGEWKQNSKQGYGRHEVFSTNQVFEGNFKNNKLNGQGKLISYNYQYEGNWLQGKKQGYGQQRSQWKRATQQQSVQKSQQNKSKQNDKQKNYDRYQYKGNFSNNEFNGNGKYFSKQCKYEYDGQFVNGLPKDYPNQFRVYVRTNIKNENGQVNEGEKVLIDAGSIFQYELESDSKNIYVQCVYQGPEYLDQNQPTEQQIQQLIKNWQNQNKKNKNPPPMPDFRAPKMKKPQLLLINQQNFRPIVFTLQKQGSDSNTQQMKIDYRKQIALKREQIQKLKEQLKKTEDQDPKKKGGKKQAKSQNEFKINVFKQKATKKQKYLKLQTQNGVCCFQKFQLPDDFPQGKFYLTIHSPFQDFGKLQKKTIQMSIKTKQLVNKKK